MSNYAVYFRYHNKKYPLPVNPEKIEISSGQSIEKYNVLKSGEIAIATHMSLKEYKFECELPKEPYHYIESKKEFENADVLIKNFQKWREELAPVRFIAQYKKGEELNELVLIEELDIVEKAGEEGDKYVSFKLVEYKEYGVKKTLNDKKASKSNQNNPKSKGYYIVKKGDCLWNIAKIYYGDGSKYTKIYAANKDKIKNPSLIYPGQKLIIPK